MIGHTHTHTSSTQSILIQARGNLKASPAPACRKAWSLSRYHAWTPERRHVCSAAAAKQPEGNPIVRAGVSGLTALLEALGIGRRAQDAQEPVRRLDRVQPGDIAAIMDRIRTDYEEHAYFVTGDIWEGIYADDCFFGDPTVSFTGLQKWRKNLQLLVPFLIDPGIELFSLSELDALASSNNSAQKLKADWRLTAYLKLPWKPFIDINGSTEYTLDPMNQQVVRHIESWSVSGTEAILQILKPSPGPRRRPEE